MKCHPRYLSCHNFQPLSNSRQVFPQLVNFQNNNKFHYARGYFWTCFGQLFRTVLVLSLKGFVRPCISNMSKVSICKGLLLEEQSCIWDATFCSEVSFRYKGVVEATWFQLHTNPASSLAQAPQGFYYTSTAANWVLAQFLNPVASQMRV